MITQPENNIRLSDEQSIALEQFQTRLSNIETEITIASKNLKSIKVDTEKAIKEKLFLEEAIEKLNKEIDTLGNNKDILANSINEGEKLLKNLSDEHAKLKSEQDLVRVELKEREEKIKENETLVSKEKEELESKLSEVEQLKQKLTSFKESLLEVINTW